MVLDNNIDLISKVSTHFVKVLESEVHEKTLCFTLEMLSLWTSKLNDEVPKSLLDIFKVLNPQRVSTNLTLDF